MNTDHLNISLEEIISQAQLALDAVGELNFSISNLNRLSRQSYHYRKFQKEIFKSIYIFLTHVSTISRMLWSDIPHKGKSSKEEKVKDLYNDSATHIITNIKRRLGPSRKDLLNNKKLRDNFNKHMEYFESMSVEQESEYDIIISPISIDHPSADKKLCYYNPISRNFHFRGEDYNIQDAATIIFKLLKYARDEQEKQRPPARRTDPVYYEESLHMIM